MNKVNDKETEKKINNKYRIIHIICLIIALLFLSTTYMFLVIDFPLKQEVSPGNVEIKNILVLFENANIKEGSKKAIIEPILDNEKTLLTYNVILSSPGQYFIFDVDIVNKGNVDTKIKDIIMNQLSNLQQEYLEYKINYKDGTNIKKDDILLKDEVKTITISLKFKDDVEITYSNEEKIDLTYEIKYIEK